MTDSAQPAQATPAKPPAPEEKPFSDFVPNLLIPAIAKEIEHQYGIAPIGTATDLVARFYAISTERKIRHPAVAAITMGARSALFAR